MKEVKVINKTLESVKDNSWVGQLSNDTTEIDFMMSQLKEMLNMGFELKDKDRIEVIKLLSNLERDKVDRAKHLDIMMMKNMKNNTNIKKEVVSLWQK